MLHSATPWWRSEIYDVAAAMPPQFDDTWAGPHGVAMVRAFPDGRTDPGWGLVGPKKKLPDGTEQQLPGFMPRYTRGEFNSRRVLFGYDRGRWSFAFVMRSLKLVAIDIDGKNGGLEHAKRLGALPPTLAETSKSGNGFHLFYLVDQPWDDKLGFAPLGDRIGVEQGVDFRATGCIYHHPQQRWNRRWPAPLPDYLFELMQHRELKQAAQTERIRKVLTDNDITEVLMMHDELITQLMKPIKQGKRNQTLFAIGCQMAEARVPGWEELLAQRALNVGLPEDEVEKLVRNVTQYGLTNAVPVGAGAP